MERTASLDLETALERTVPTRTQWDAWIRTEPSLAALTYGDLRRVLRTGCQDRKDEILGALVRATHADPGAFGVVAACLLPGLRRRIAHYAPSLDRQEALAVMVDALYEAVAGYDTAEHSRFVAGGLLALPTRRLRHAATNQRSWSLHARHDTDAASAAPGVELSAAAMLASAVNAAVVTDRDAQLILDTRIVGRSLREAAQRLGLRYETAKKRRQRAEARWASWWTSGETPPALRRTDGRPRREEVA
jgi:DNA-directed RNA polymerase specialized sigma24 family protein